MNWLASLLFARLLVGFYCQADIRKNDRYLENFDLYTKKETAMENVIDTEGQTRFFDELGQVIELFGELLSLPLLLCIYNMQICTLYVGKERKKGKEQRKERTRGQQGRGKKAKESEEEDKWGTNVREDTLS